jgi:hypothetical protein
VRPEGLHHRRRAGVAEARELHREQPAGQRPPTSRRSWTTCRRRSRRARASCWSAKCGSSGRPRHA